MIDFINVSLAAVASRARTLGTKACGSKCRASFFRWQLATVARTSHRIVGREPGAPKARRAGGEASETLQDLAITLTRQGFKTTTASSAATMFAAAAMMNTRSQLPVSFWIWFV